MRNRTRALLAATGLGVALVAFAAPAVAADTTTTPQPATTSAQPVTTSAEPPFTHEATQQCYDLLKGNPDATIDDCQKAPSPLLPAKNEIIWGSLAFLVLLVAMWKWGVPAVKNMEQAREDRIRTDLESAEKARNEAETESAQYRAQLGDARSEAARIIDEARQAADGVRRDLVARAEQEAAQIRANATADLQLQVERATADLRQQVAALSVELAGRIIERNLDAATQQQLIDSYINSVGSN